MAILAKNSLKLTFNIMLNISEKITLPHPNISTLTLPPPKKKLTQFIQYFVVLTQSASEATKIVIKYQPCV